MAAPHQAHYESQVPQQHQNVGQQRQVPNGQQQNFGQAQQRPVQLQQQQQQQQQQPLNSYANFDPQLASFILEKPRNATSWEDAAPEKQHVALQELRNELHKFRRNHGNVKKAMNEIPSPNCRRIINELVENQNVELVKYNRTIQYRIASVVNKWRSVNRRDRQLVRVDIILETEPSGFRELLQTKATATGGPQDPNKVKQPENSQSQHIATQPNPTQNMPQQQRPPHQQQQPQQHQRQQHPSQEQGQHFEPPRHQHRPSQASMNQMPGSGNPPPPPPPPPPPDMLGPHNMGGPPHPPMPGPHDMGGPPHPPMHGGGSRLMQGTPMQHPQPYHPRHDQPPMSDAFSEQMHMPPNGMRHGQSRPVEILNPDHLRHQKARHKGRRDASGSSSENDSFWEDDSEHSSFVNVEHDDHGDAGRRERGRQRHDKRSKKSQKHRSLSKSRGLSRSRSLSRARRSNVDPYAAKSSRRRRASDLIEDPRNGRHSPESFTTNSSRSSQNKIPGQMPPVHIHLSTNNVVEDRTRNGNASPADLYSEKRKSGKHYTSHDMACESSSSSSERGSGTESMNTASAHTAENGVWDTPLRRRPSFKHVQSRRNSFYGTKPQTVFDQPHPSHIYDDDVDHRRTQKVRHSRELVDGYPHARSPRTHAYEPESYFDDHPAHAVRPNLPNRRATMANPCNNHNPFAQSHFPPKPIRASSHLVDRHEPGYSFPQPRALTSRDEQDERFGLGDIHAALEHIQEKKDMRHSMGRPNVMGRRDSAFQYNDDEWDIRVPLSARRGGYDRY